MMRRTAMSLTLAAAFAPAVVARAGEELTDLEALLDESVVSAASLTNESARTAPATSTVITSDELRRFGIRTLDQALNFLSLGVVTQDNGSAPEIGARGVHIAYDYGAHMLLLVDGHVMNEPWDGTAYFCRSAAVPFELIDHIEVVLGPGSVLYGSHAMLGVINVVTKSAKDYAGALVVAESELPISGRAALGFGVDFELGGERGELTLQVEHFVSEGPERTYGPQDYGADAVTGQPKRFSFSRPATGVWGGTARQTLFAEIPALYARARWADWTLALHAAESRRGTPWVGGGNFDDPQADERDRWLQLDLKRELALGSLATLTGRLYGDLYQYRQRVPAAAAEDCLEGQVGGCLYRLRGRSRWTGAELRLAADWTLDGRFVTLLGVDGRLRFVDSREAYRDVTTGVAIETQDYAIDEHLVAVYLEQQLHPWSSLALNAGARFDYDEVFGGHLSPRVAAAFTPVVDGTVKLLYAEAFRTLSAYERFYADPTWFIASPNLEPEVVRSVELSYEHRLGTVRLFAGGFFSHWSALVAERDATEAELAEAIAAGELESYVTAAGRYDNLTGLQSLGGNLAVHGSALARRLRYGLTFTAARTRTDDDAALVVAPSWFGNARVAYDLGGPAWPTLALAARVISSRLIDASSFGEARAPVQLELRGAVTGELPGLPELQVRLVASYALSDRTPYTIGPLGEPSEEFTRDETVPVDRFRTMVTVSYNLPL